MAKLRADINYNQRIQQEDSIKEDTNLNEKDNEGTADVLIHDNEDILNDDESDDQDEEEAKLTSQFNDHLNEWLELLQQEENNEDIEDIEHPAQNTDAKWNLGIIFENNLHKPF